jgi:DNA-nicking Smr family endonuclease
VKPPRGLSAAEATLWRRVTDTVVPLAPPRNGEGDHAKHGGGVQGASASLEGQATPHLPLHQPAAGPPPRPGEDLGKTKPLSPTHGLDSSWERKLAKAAIEPDFTLDLHGHTLDQAHARLDSGLIQAKAMGARLVLLITGNPRAVDAADRGTRRGAIRAKVLDWLAAGPHGSDIAAVRPAHRRHGGAGALYLVLRRGR